MLQRGGGELGALLLAQGAWGGAGQCPWEVATAGGSPGLPGNGVPKEGVLGKNGKKCEPRGKRESVTKWLAPTRNGYSRNRKKNLEKLQENFLRDCLRGLHASFVYFVWVGFCVCSFFLWEKGRKMRTCCERGASRRLETRSWAVSRSSKRPCRPVPDSYRYLESTELVKIPDW